MSDQQPPYRPEGQQNSPGWSGPWPQQGDSSTPQPGGPSQPGGGASPWGPDLEDAPTYLAGQPRPPGPHSPSGPHQQVGQPQTGQPGGWPSPADGGYQPGGWPAAPANSQPGWGAQPAGGNPPSWPQQPGEQPWQDTNQWQQDNQWQQQQPGGSWPQQQPPQPQQAGYQQGWPPPGGQPGQPGPPGGKKKTNPVFVIVPLALVAAIVLGVVIALAVRNGDDKDATASPTGSASPAVTTPPLNTGGPQPTPSTSPVAAAPTGGPPGAPNCAPVAPVTGTAPAGVLDIGQTAHIVSDDEYDIADFEANVTINGVCTQTTAFEDWSEPPVQGNFVLADVTVELVAGEVSATYFDFSVQTADGALFSGDFPPIEPRLASFDLAAGSTVRGFILVDAPVGSHVIRWEPSYATSVGQWRY